MICWDSVEMGWLIFGDLCINENKFVGCLYYRNFVGIWVLDISVLLFIVYVYKFCER